MFQERKWDFCVAEVLKLCLWGRRIPCQFPMGTELEKHRFLTSVGQFGSVELSCEEVTRRVRVLVFRNLSMLQILLD